MLLQCPALPGARRINRRWSSIPGAGVALWEMLGVLRDVAPAVDARLKEITEMRPESMQIGRKLEKRKGTARKKKRVARLVSPSPSPSPSSRPHCLPRDSSLLVPFWTPVLGRSVSISPLPTALSYNRIPPPPHGKPAAVLSQ